MRELVGTVDHMLPRMPLSSYDVFSILDRLCIKPLFTKTFLQTLPEALNYSDLLVMDHHMVHQFAARAFRSLPRPPNPSPESCDSDLPSAALAETGPPALENPGPSPMLRGHQPCTTFPINEAVKHHIHEEPPTPPNQQAALHTTKA